MAKVRQSLEAWRENRDKWAKIWFEKLCVFHERKPTPTWEFTKRDVLAFLRDHLQRKTPTWKRLKIIESLMCYRKYVQNLDCDELKILQGKLEETLRAERHEDLKNAGAEEITDEIGYIDPREPDVIQSLRRTIRGKQDALETERAYVSDVRRLMRDRGLKSLADFDSIKSTDVEDHLTDLAVDGNVAPSTQERAFYAILYLFEHVLKRSMGEVNAIRSNKGKQIPTVLSVDEIERIYSHLRGVHLLIAKLLYGCGMRISEVLRLRVKDFDFDQRLIEVHKSKGGKSRFVPMPESVVPEIRRWMESRRVLHDHDLDQGHASVCLPKALERKYPNAAKELKWQFLFASHRLSRDPRTRVLRRHHLHKDTFPAQLRAALKKAGIEKHVSSHTFRHSFATHLLRANTDIVTIQELLGHADIKTTRIYLHALNRDDVKVVSPLDRMTSLRSSGEQSVVSGQGEDSSHGTGSSDPNEVREIASTGAGRRHLARRSRRVPRSERVPVAIIRPSTAKNKPARQTATSTTQSRWWKRAANWSLSHVFTLSGFVLSLNGLASGPSAISNSG